MVRFSSLLMIMLGAALAAGDALAQRAVLLDFSMPGCIPCRQMDPVVTRLQQEGYPVRKIDGMQQPQVAAQFGVDRYPTFVLVVDGRPVQKAIGLQSYETLRGWLASARPASAQPASAIAPVTFAEPVNKSNDGFQVGSDLGAAPEVTIPGADHRPQPRAPASQAASAGGPDAQTLLAVSVRLKVKDSGGSSFGTGTIIDARQGEALVLTCGHLFRDDGAGAASAGAPPEIMVELFDASRGAPQVVDRVAGRLISFDLDRDVALVSIRPRGEVRAARIASSPVAAGVGDAAWSVGCDRGADPTVRTGRVTTVDRYQKPASLTVTGAPTIGRSGGGLFNERGEVVGVCFGADEPGDEGFYAKLSSIHAELDKLGLTEIYQPGAPTQMASAQTPAPAATASSAEIEPGMVAVSPRPPVVRGQDAFDPAFQAAGPLAGVTATERAALEELSRRAAESEVVCVIRPKTPGGKSEVITLDRVSPAFLQALESMRGGAPRR